MPKILLNSFYKNGHMVMLAFDHRGSFEKAMEISQNHKVDDNAIIALKSAIIKSANHLASGLLIDQEYGLPAYQSLGIQSPFLLPMEKTGYTDAAGERITELQYNAQSIEETGAQGAKLLLYTNPYVSSWKMQMETARLAIDDAHSRNLPLFLEFVLYDANGISAGTVVENVSRAIAEGICPDVWKVAYPGSREACHEMTKIVGNTPWILLTGGEPFTVFKEHFQEACREGSSGCLAGRALWVEACKLYTEPKLLQTFLETTLKERMQTLLE